MRVDDFDFDLPNELIALHPAEPRDSARMLVVKPGEGLADRVVTDLLEILQAGDVLVVNDTKVLPADLRGIRAAEGAAWVALSRASPRPYYRDRDSDACARARNGGKSPVPPRQTPRVRAASASDRSARNRSTTTAR